MWWVHYTLNFDCRTRRVRRSLKTGSLDEAIRRRDDLFARLQAEGEDVPVPHAVKCAAKFYGLAANEYRSAGLGLLARKCWREAAKNYAQLKVNEEAERCLAAAAEVQEYWEGGAS